ncbi:MAG TPA: hypothetical protein VGR35_11735 [Tepidisphaeraceae bacterium]|nr:hypothetical protein [Tepidisphaeraceae bacterium]
MQPVVFITEDGRPIDSALALAIMPRPGNIVSIGGTPEAPAHKYVVTDAPPRWHKCETKFVTYVTVRPA